MLEIHLDYDTSVIYDGLKSEIMYIIKTEYIKALTKLRPIEWKNLVLLDLSVFNSASELYQNAMIVLDNNGVTNETFIDLWCEHFEHAPIILMGILDTAYNIFTYINGKNSHIMIIPCKKMSFQTFNIQMNDYITKLAKSIEPNASFIKFNI